MKTEFQENLDFLMKLDDQSFQEFVDSSVIFPLKPIEATIPIFHRILNLEIRLPSPKLISYLNLQGRKYNLSYYLSKSKLSLQNHVLLMSFNNQPQKIRLSAYEFEDIKQLKPEFTKLLKSLKFDFKNLFYYVFLNPDISIDDSTRIDVEMLLLQVLELESIFGSGKLYLLKVLIDKESLELAMEALLEGEVYVDCPKDLDYDVQSLYFLNNTHVETQDQVSQQSYQVNVLSDRRNIFDGDEFDVFTNGGELKKSTEVVVDHQKDKTIQLALNQEVERQTLILLAEKHNQEQRQILEQHQLKPQNEQDDDTQAPIKSKKDTRKENKIEMDMKKDHHKLLASIEDDEADDSYDHIKTPTKLVISQTEKQLIKLYQENSGIFHRSLRKTKERNEILKDLKWSDEQFEGWYLVFCRNPLKEMFLENIEFGGDAEEDAHEEEDVNSTRSRGRSYIGNESSKQSNGASQSGRCQEKIVGEKDTAASTANGNTAGAAPGRARGRGRGGRGRWARPR
jgi:hypothetical protein